MCKLGLRLVSEKKKYDFNAGISVKMARFQEQVILWLVVGISCQTGQDHLSS